MSKIDDFIPTRLSLLGRLKNWKDQESWNAFVAIYKNLIHSTATRAGLTDAEAQDVVQETLLSVSKSMPHFQYNSDRGSFKSWLLRLTKWRIADQLRQRDDSWNCAVPVAADSPDTPVAHRIPDPAGPSAEAIWEREWEKNLLGAAMQRVKRQVDPKHYQIFDLYAVKEWPVSKVTRILGVRRGTVYLVKHRINRLIQREIARLRAKPF